MVAKHVSLMRNERESERSDVSVMSRASTNEPEPAIIGEVVSFFFAGTYCSRTKQTLQRQKSGASLL
ncbi:hypothetical protein NP92_08230 [Anoxybacillus gonensis]|uniref:hypothetical protein n=1 Tax=Anoxybacillus gonensis TaxID=198467 RepID=UPI00052CD000|nr:hypothetical protein [Anoxybacillus gonensis]AKS38427.1 hypothetical protein AFK25_07640 [Anoxybacillus gonensis]KGP60407.1 hypothetical protein NP92_08230 [Anoxybacillus gonensis]